jgi:hypothetical protein
VSAAEQVAEQSGLSPRELRQQAIARHVLGELDIELERLRGHMKRVEEMLESAIDSSEFRYLSLDAHFGLSPFTAAGEALDAVASQVRTAEGHRSLEQRRYGLGDAWLGGVVEDEVAKLEPGDRPWWIARGDVA